MFSSSNSFLGGAGTARPGQQQSPYLQQPYSQSFPGQQQATQQQPQPTGFAPQPTGFAPQFTSTTGFGGSQLQPQATGFSGGQLQPQFTGFPAGAAPQQQQPPLPPLPPLPQQPQQLQPQQTAQPGFISPQPPQFTGYATAPQPQSQQPPLPQLQVQNTAMPLRPGPKTSAEMADSFAGGERPQPPPKSVGNKIPSIRLSFITAQDQAKFEQLFKSAVGDDQTMDGE